MCSYCGCENIALIGRFMAEHVEIVNALTALRAACHDADAAAVGAAVDAMEALLHPHTGAEEVGLFAQLRLQDEFADTIDSLCAEHVTLDAQLMAIRGGEHTAYEQFEHDLRRHIDHEDNGLFPAAAIAMSGPDWEEALARTPGRGLDGRWDAG